MRRLAGAALLLTAALSGCMSVDHGPEMSGPVCSGHGGQYAGPPTVPNVQGPWGQPVAMAAPYSASGPVAPWAAPRMMSNSVPLDMVQMAGLRQASAQFPVPPGQCGPNGCLPGQVMPPGGLMSPPGVPFGPNPGLLPPGPGGPGGAAVPPGGMQLPPGMAPPGNQVAAAGGQLRFPACGTQVRFVGPSSMRITWQTVGPDGKQIYANAPIEAPGRYNFLQAAIYRLKLSNIEGRPGLELYPTLEVVPCNPRTEAFLSHSAVPVMFTAEDFQQVAAGNYLVKVIYLPNPEFQELAATGTEEVVSTRLEPGADPIKEALRRGSILLVIRMGNMDQEAPNTPPINAPGPGASQMPAPPAGPMGAMGPMGPMGMPQGPGIPMGPMGMMPPPGMPMGPGAPMGGMPPAGASRFLAPTQPTSIPLPPGR